MMIAYSIIQMIVGIILLFVTKAKMYGNDNPFAKQQFEVSVGLIVLGVIILIYNIFFIKGYSAAKRKLSSET
ncbi:hypothetical protein [Clostridium folliculivorans]|uniref:hypothetical protein n=1 Tax=Clostridium folliculivorans TaxID=2886038 RepID=UPI0021C27980|nr:hypothetical protein [Clostridium folliculivorans]